MYVFNKRIDKEAEKVVFPTRFTVSVFVHLVKKNNTHQRESRR